MEFYEEHGILCGTTKLSNNVTGVLLLQKFSQPNRKFGLRRRNETAPPQWLVWERPFFDAGQEYLLDDGWTVITASFTELGHQTSIFERPVRWVFDVEIVAALANLYLTPQIGFDPIRLPKFEFAMLEKTFKVVGNLPIRAFGDLRSIINSAEFLVESPVGKGLVADWQVDKSLIFERQKSRQIANQLVQDEEFRMKLDFLLTQLQFAGIAVSVARYRPKLNNQVE